jgi:hypothetical protein
VFLKVGPAKIFETGWNSEIKESTGATNETVYNFPFVLFSPFVFGCSCKRKGSRNAPRRLWACGYVLVMSETFHGFATTNFNFGFPRLCHRWFMSDEMCRCVAGSVFPDVSEELLLSSSTVKYSNCDSIITPTKCTLLLLKAPDITICALCLIFCPYMFQPAWVIFKGLNASACLKLLLITIY